MLESSFASFGVQSSRLWGTMPVKGGDAIHRFVQLCFPKLRVLLSPEMKEYFLP